MSSRIISIILVLLMEINCPLCGTRGRLWHSNPDVFRCPNCSSIFSEFGMVLESEAEHLNLWT